jgi:hypothetical protein
MTDDIIIEEEFTLVKSRGRQKKRYLKRELNKKGRARTSSPAGGNSAKCCSYCCPKYSINHVNKEFNRMECQQK